MQKLIFGVMSLSFFMLSCDLPATGGNPGEGRPCNEKVLRTHAGSLMLDLDVKCLYKKECSVKLNFRVTGLPDSLKGMCFGGGSEWQYESIDTSMTVTTKLNNLYPVKLSQDDHLRFSLIDINNIERKYDIDFSEIIHSYTVRGDSIEIKMPVGNFDMLVECPYCLDYGRSYSLCEGGLLCHYHSQTSLSAVVGTSSRWGEDFAFHYGLSNQGSTRTDSVYVHGTIGIR